LSIVSQLKGELSSWKIGVVFIQMSEIKYVTLYYYECNIVPM
jgi:hypothetical protein